MNTDQVGIIGASSMVGAHLCQALVQAQWQVTGFSRAAQPAQPGINWQQLPASNYQTEIPYWVSLAPLWTLPDYFPFLAACGAKRIVALSTTSIFTKQASSDAAETALVAKLIAAEQALQDWAQEQGIDWILLRPTLIYDPGKDANITQIMRVIETFGCFPLLGAATGLRQPIHAADVAAACIAALTTTGVRNQAYNISGAETLSYAAMVIRIFNALGRRPRLIRVPLWCFRLAVPLARALPRYRHLSAAMAQRMNQDLAFDHSAASCDLGFQPRPFRIDLP